MDPPPRITGRTVGGHSASRRLPDGSCQRFFAARVAHVAGRRSPAAALERMDASDFDTIQTPSGRTADGHFPSMILQHSTELQRRYTELTQHLSTPRLTHERMGSSAMDQCVFNGLRPEPLHVAIRYDAECRECIGIVCPRGCKSDARVACLEEALRQPRCALLDRCDVHTFMRQKSHPCGQSTAHDGRDLELHAKVVVLAAGAFHSPQILLRSRNSLWPNGLANNSDQVGRNLMFHTSDIIALWARIAPTGEPAKRRQSPFATSTIERENDSGYVQHGPRSRSRGDCRLSQGSIASSRHFQRTAVIHARQDSVARCEAMSTVPASSPP